MRPDADCHFVGRCVLPARPRRRSRRSRRRIDGTRPAALGASTIAGSLSVTLASDLIAPIKDRTPRLPNDPQTDSIHAAGGGAGSATFSLDMGGVYELKLLPDWDGGAAFSDVSVGIYKLDGAPATDVDGWFMQSGETHLLGPIAAAATMHVRGLTAAGLAAGRWKCRRIDA